MNPSGCIFCGESPLTSEHLISNWIRELITADKPEPSAPGNVVVAKHERWTEGAEQDEHQEWFNRIAPDLQVKCVCANCNGGWMSNLEEAVAPTLTAMMDGQPTVLANRDQAVVARWLGLKAIIAHEGLPGQSGVEQWASAFYKDKRPPNTWHVRLGRYEGKRPMFFGCTGLNATLGHRIRPSIRSHPGFIFVTQLGSFVGQVVGLHQLTRFLRPVNRLIQIWPHPLLRADSPDLSRLGSITWPPDGWLSDSELREAISDPEKPR